jgi:hypothetical protein
METGDIKIIRFLEETNDNSEEEEMVVADAIEKEFESLGYRQCGKYLYYPHGPGYAQIKSSKKKYISDCVKKSDVNRICDLVKLKGFDHMDTNKIGFSNGIFDIENYWFITKSDKRINNKYYIDVHFPEKLIFLDHIYVKNLDEYLDESIGKDNNKLFYGFIGYTLLRKTHWGLIMNLCTPSPKCLFNMIQSVFMYLFGDDFCYDTTTFNENYKIKMETFKKEKFGKSIKPGLITTSQKTVNHVGVVNFEFNKTFHGSFSIPHFLCKAIKSYQEINF